MESWKDTLLKLKKTRILTNFQKVQQFNELFGAVRYDSLSPQIFEQDVPLVKLRLSLIDEEVRELKHAMERHDLLETIDALADILYVVYGAGDAFGIDLDKAFNAVHESNMSKLCQTESEAQETVKWYLDHRTEHAYDSPNYRLASDGQHWVVYNQSTGKILKSINYHPPDFS